LFYLNEESMARRRKYRAARLASTHDFPDCHQSQSSRFSGVIDKAIAERVGQLMGQAANGDRRQAYLAHSKVDFFGEEEKKSWLAHSDGAGGPIESVRAHAFALVVA
jgi:hypothetical protein